MPVYIDDLYNISEDEFSSFEPFMEKLSDFVTAILLKDSLESGKAETEARKGYAGLAQNCSA